MNEDMPWVNLTQEEVNDLRNKKFELTQYGKEKLRKLMNKDLTFKINGEETFSIPSQTLEKLTLGTKTPETQLEVKEMTTGQLMDTEKFQEEFAKSQVFDADKFADEERKQRSDTVLARYNRFYHDEVSGLPHGTPITMEQLQCITLSCAIDALMCENMNVEYDTIAIDDIKVLIAGLYQQGNEYLKRVQEFKDSADGVA